MEYKSYMHVVRYGSEACKNIEKGRVFIFPKIDGSNGTVYKSSETICVGGRHRKLSEEDGNNGMYKHVMRLEGIKNYLNRYPNRRLYGEWLIPHTIKGYIDEAWNKFYVFDVEEYVSEDNYRFIPYDEYVDEFEELGIRYIPAYAMVNNEAEFSEFLVNIDEHIKKSRFLLKDGVEGEGFVFKNYDFKNRHGLTIWGKVISSEFNNRGNKNAAPKSAIQSVVEYNIVESFVTDALCQKEYAKILNEHKEWSKELTKTYLDAVYYSLISEDMWDILDKFKNPIINFSVLRGLVYKKAKDVLA